MISKNRLKFLKSLHHKKYRKVHQTFLVEGQKNSLETLKSDRPIQSIYCTEAFFNLYSSLIETKTSDYHIVSPQDLAQAGTLVSNQSSLLLMDMPDIPVPTVSSENYTLVLDGIQDPGNLGSILRIADWFGISQIIASLDTVDVYNPKVIAASMGSFLRVQVYCTELLDFFKKINPKNIYGASLEGEDLHQIQFAPQGGYLVLGNESQGIRPDTYRFVQHRVHIPRYGQAESLNVAMATAIICDNLRRQIG